jgi:glycosyltransferase involved in cell wall biosynthesis
MHLGLYESSLTGHQGAHVQAIVGASIRRGWKVTLVLPASESEHPMFHHLSTVLGPDNLIVSPHACPIWTQRGKAGLLAHHFRQHRTAARSFALVDKRCDFIYTSNLGLMDKAMLVLGPPSPRKAMGGMCMRVRFHMPYIEGQASRHSVKVTFGEMQLRRLASIAGVTTADPALFEFCQNGGGSLRNIRFVPEIGMERPSISKIDARRKLGIAESDRVILVYGGLTPKKAVAELVAATALIPEEQRVLVLAVGKPDEWMTGYLATAEARLAMEQRRLVVHGRFADRALEEAAFASADAAWVAYNDAGSMSGVFFQAVCSGLPVIAPMKGILRWLVRRHGVGISVDPQDAPATAKTILSLLSDPHALQTVRANTEAIAERHLPSTFGDAVCDAICGWLGRS